jgi:hypothetical protein
MYTLPVLLSALSLTHENVSENLLNYKIDKNIAIC